MHGSSRGQKLNPKFFFSNFSGTAGISQQNPGISRQKSLISLLSRGIPNFLPPPLHVEDPHPTGRYPDPKVWVWVRFSSMHGWLRAGLLSQTGWAARASRYGDGRRKRPLGTPRCSWLACGRQMSQPPVYLAAQCEIPPRIAQYPFEIVSQRGVSHPFALFSEGIVQVSLRYPFWGGGIAPPLCMLCKGESLRKGGGGIAPNWPCWDTKNPIARNRGVSLR